MKNMSDPTASGKVGAIAPDLEEPMVMYHYRLARHIANKVRIHPNIITLGRLALMIWLTWSFYKGRHVIWAALALQVCFFLDHLDGEMARTHNMVTPFGDYLDHTLDLVYGWPLAYVIGLKLRRKRSFWPVMGLVGTVTLLSGFVIACQEIILAKHDPDKASQSLAISHKMCPTWVRNNLHVLRYSGVGMLHVVVGMTMIYTKYYA